MVCVCEGLQQQLLTVWHLTVAGGHEGLSFEQQSERDPDTSFVVFERVAQVRGCSDEERLLLLQCVFTGKAQKAYSAVCVRDNLTYRHVKEAVLKVYQLTAEASRQWVKSEKQTNVEFAGELTHLKRWCAAVGMRSCLI